MEEPLAETTRLLQRMRAGDPDAEAALYPRVYDELHRLARRYLRDRQPGQTLQPTVLVHEAYLRLTGDEEGAWNSRAHFVGVAAKAMRSALVDHVRRGRAAKRGGDQERLGLDAVAASFQERVPDLLELDEALTRLARFDPDGARVVELRFFAGLSHAEAAEAMESSERTVRRLWQTARLWLKRELESRGAD